MGSQNNDTSLYHVILFLDKMAALSSIFRKGLFNGKVAIVTGGGTGIGQAIALELMYLGKFNKLFRMYL